MRLLRLESSGSDRWLRDRILSGWKGIGTRLAIITSGTTVTGPADRIQVQRGCCPTTMVNASTKVTGKAGAGGWRTIIIGIVTGTVTIVTTATETKRPEISRRRHSRLPPLNRDLLEAVAVALEMCLLAAQLFPPLHDYIAVLGVQLARLVWCGPAHQLAGFLRRMIKFLFIAAAQDEFRTRGISDRRVLTGPAVPGRVLLPHVPARARVDTSNASV